MAEFYVFLDESGDDNLAAIDKEYPVFVLGAVAMERNYHNSVALGELAALKARYATPGLILHTADMLRCRQGFEFLRDATVRQAFYSELNELIRQLDFVFVPVVLDLLAVGRQWGSTPRSPYGYAMVPLIEKVRRLLDGRGTAMYFAETRRPQTDAEYAREYAYAAQHGLVAAGHVLLREEPPQPIQFLPKNANPGAEIVDLLVTPIGRWFLGKQSPFARSTVLPKLPGGEAATMADVIRLP